MDIVIKLSADNDSFNQEMKRLQVVMALAANSMPAIADAIQAVFADIETSLLRFGIAVAAFESQLSPEERALFYYENGVE